MSPRVISPVLLALLLALAPAGARGDDDDAMDRLQAAVARGEVKPLSELLRSLRRAFPGEVIDVELDDDDGRFRYEFKVLQADGRLLEIEMDAASGRVLDVEND